LAAVDLGSNSFHLQIARVVDDQIYLLDSLRDPLRLGAGLTRDRRIDQATKTRALEVLARFSERLRGFSRSAVRAVGTSALRVAKNAPQFLREARSALGFPIEVIAGREEARLIYLGVAHSMPPSARVSIASSSSRAKVCPSAVACTSTMRPAPVITTFMSTSAVESSV